MGNSKKSKMTMRTHIVYMGIVSCILIAIFVVMNGITKYSVDRTVFVDEFKGAYEKEVKKNGTIVQVDMIADESEIEIFDGYTTKVWAYNGMVPGPEIRVALGDTLRINFTNKLPQETTIHFHGVRVPNAMDGVPGVTQDPIQPGESFVYEFAPKDVGTYWFHPHVRSSEQVERGLFGTLIVEDATQDKYTQDIVWVIDDWRMTQDKQVYTEFNIPMDVMHDGRWGNVITVNARRMERVNVQPGERIRIRLVNASNARIYMPELLDIDAKIIAIDGMAVAEVFDFGTQELAPGNRIDIDVTIPQDAGGKEFVLVDTFGNTTNILARISVSTISPIQTPDFVFPINDKIPQWKGIMNIGIDKEYRLNLRRKSGGMMGGIEWTINEKAYPEYDPFALVYGEINTLRFVNESTRLHPMHLHGQFFKVIARDGVSVNEAYFRDTVLVYPKQTVDIALVPLDKGTWVNHCHVLEHAEAGMMTAVTVE